MKKILFPICSLLVCLISWAFVNEIKSTKIDAESRVSDLLATWTGKKPLQYIEKPDNEQIRIGKELVYQGWATVDGKKSKLISNYFTCTNCHNQVIEDEDLRNPTPEKRLKMAVKNNLPFLQGTTFYGQANRNHWYNGDYHLKYGALVANTRDTLANAVQLCAKVCSSGRYLEKWELDAIMHYLNSIDYKLSDLKISADDLQKLNSNDLTNDDKASLLQSYFMDYSPATFLNVITKKERKWGAGGDSRRGKEIYVQSCMACHNQENESTMFKLDTTALTLKFMKKNARKNNIYSIYNIVREGTTAEFAIKAYMPHYTAERMSEKQLEDLASFIMF
jgi:cytochrome c